MATVAAEARLPPYAERLRRLLSLRTLVVAFVAAVIAYLALVPLGFLLWQTFFKGGTLTLMLPSLTNVSQSRKPRGTAAR